MLENIVGIAITIAVVAAAIWLFLGPATAAPGQGTDDETIDPSDPEQLGRLIGLTGGSITDAVTAQFAIRRFEENTGRRATFRDAATVAGLVSTIKSDSL